MSASNLVPARTLRVPFGRLRWPKDDLEVLLALDALYDADEAGRGRLVVVPAIALSWTYLRASWDLGRVMEVVEDYRNGRPLRLGSTAELLQRETVEAGPEQLAADGVFSVPTRSTDRPRRARINDGDFGPGAVAAFDALTSRVAGALTEAPSAKGLNKRTSDVRRRAPWGLFSDAFAALVRQEMNLPDRLSTLDVVSMFVARTSTPLTGTVGASHSPRDAFLFLAGQLEDKGYVDSGRRFAQAVLEPIVRGDLDQSASRIGQEYERIRRRVREWGMTNLIVPDREQPTIVAASRSAIREDLAKIAASVTGPPVRSVFDSASSPSLSLKAEKMAGRAVGDWFDTSRFWKLVYIIAGGDLTRFERIK